MGERKGDSEVIDNDGRNKKEIVKEQVMMGERKGDRESRRMREANNVDKRKGNTGW